MAYGYYDGWLDTFVGWIVEAVLFGIFIIPVLVFGILSCVQARAKGDPLRKCFRFLHPAWWLFFITLCLRVPLAIFSDTYPANLWLSAFVILFAVPAMTMATILLFMLGVALIQQHEQAKRWHSVVTMVAQGVCAIELVLTIAMFGKYLRYTIRGGDSGLNFFDFITGMNLTIYVLHWILSLVLFGIGVLAVKKTRRAPGTRTIGQIFTAAVVLWLARAFFLLILSIRDQTQSWKYNAEFYSLRITGPIFDAWIFFVVLVLAYVIGQKKVGGLWSNPEGRAPTTMYQGGYAYGPGPGMVPPPNQMGYYPQGQPPMYQPQYYPQVQPQQYPQAQPQPVYAVGQQPASPPQNSAWAAPGQGYAAQSPGSQAPGPAQVSEMSANPSDRHGEVYEAPGTKA